jgi:hypothetical protein
MRRSRLVRAAAVLALFAIPPVLSGGRALAIVGPEYKVLFGPVGVGAGQGARINVYGIGNPNESPWEFAVRIFNRRAELVQERRFRVAPGVIASVEVSLGGPDTFPADRLGRRTLRAEIVGFNPQPDPPGKYSATFEIYSLVTGHTSILLGGPDTLPPVPGLVP